MRLATVEIIESEGSINASDKVFKNTYEKLLDGTLKARYTRARRQGGYEGGPNFIKKMLGF